MNILRKELTDYKLLLRSLPASVVSLFLLSVILMNLLSNKELVSTKYFALDCGYTLSWVTFLCMDMICRRFGGKAAAKLSFLALAVNFAVTFLFKLVAKAPGMWGAYYATGLNAANDALNATFAGSWYVVFGSSLAMAISAVINSLINMGIGKRLKRDDFGAFAVRSYISTGISQLIDNFVFISVVSCRLFGWTLTQALICSVTSMLIELLCEIIFSPLGYKIVKQWEQENVGSAYYGLSPRNDPHSPAKPQHK